jgi:hypothetical protein
VANVIPLRQSSSKTGPFEAMRDLQALYARLMEINDATRSMAQRMAIAQPESNAAASLTRAGEDLKGAADQILDAIACAIVHQTATLVVPAAPNPDMPDEIDTRS